MTETATQAPAVYVPGKHEAEALRFMHEWEPSARAPSKHIVAQQVGPDMFQVFAWSPRDKVWRPWDAGPQNCPRRVAVDAMLAQIEWADLTIMDEPVDFADYDGFAPTEFDRCAFCGTHTMICPVGVPGGDGGWARVSLDGNGIGKPLSSGRYISRSDDYGDFFPEHALAMMFRRLALPVDRVRLGNESILRVAPVLIRHERVAREVVPKEGWGIAGRPDLLARQMDRELAINAAAEEESTRLWKEGVTLPPSQIRFEIAVRMEKEWAAQPA